MEVVYSGLIDVDGNRQNASQPHSLTTVIDAVFETEYAAIVHRLISPATVYTKHRSRAIPGLKALWDTGSVTSCISSDAVKKLDPAVLRRKTVILANGQLEASTYLVDIVLWDTMEFNDIEVTEFPLENHDCDILIGMDVISRGKLTVDSREGKTRITFSM